MRTVRSRPRLVAALGVAAVGLLATSVALGSHGSGTGLGLLAEGTTLNEVNFNEDPLKLRTKGPVIVRHSRVVRTGTPLVVGFHTHPGPEIVVVDEGTATITMNNGGSCESVEVGPDKAYIVPPGISFSLTTSAAADFTATLILTPGEPISGPGEACS